MDSPTCPLDSGIGWTVGYDGPKWERGFSWTVPHTCTCPVVERDRTDSVIGWSQAGQRIPMEHGQ